MARRTRLDVELVRRGLARSREHAATLVADGKVEVKGRLAAKVATMVDPADPVHVMSGRTEYVSRGGYKLAGALADFADLRVAGRRCLDAGISTGGFTDVLLRHGAAKIIGVDVGYGQVAWSLRKDSRVELLERTNVRGLIPEAIGGPVDLTVVDLSFISLRQVLPALATCTAEDLVPMVKPQFEVGPDRVGSGGVVHNPAWRAEAVLGVTAVAATLGLGVAGFTESVLPGTAGNVEYFVWLRRDAPPVDEAGVRVVTG